nr:hypothetical protein [Candidatus Bathyarchaeota archaeon]NIU81806.1 hypothetical protein [Candidatus Bathyarchaeota archaeon]
KISMEASLDLQTTDREEWSEVFKRLRVQGFGDFYLRDKYLVIRTPFISNHKFLAGFLEGLLSVQLGVKTLNPPLIFEIAEQ